MIQFCNLVCFYCEIMNFLDIGWQLYLILFSLMVLVPVTIGLVLLRINKNWLKPVLWSALSCTGAFLWTAWWFNHNNVFIQDNSMLLQAGFYQTTVSDLSLPQSAIDVMPQDELGAYTPRVAINGINLPEYQVGWYLLANSKMAFVMLIGSPAEITVVNTPSMTAVVGGNIHQISLVAAQ